MSVHLDLDFLDIPTPLHSPPPQEPIHQEASSQGQSVVQIAEQQQQTQRDHDAQKFNGGHDGGDGD